MTGTPIERARLWLAVALLTLLILCGDAARANVYSLLVLRPACVLIAKTQLSLPGTLDWQTGRMSPVLLGAFLVIVAVQLVPRPPDLWLSLLGRDRYGEAAIAAETPQPWRMISLAPALTLNSIVSLVVHASVVVAAATLRPDQR